MTTHPTRRSPKTLIAALAAALVLAAAAWSAAAYIGGFTITVSRESVDGTTEQVLTTHDGMTLYYSTRDTAKASRCTGACTHTWKPFALVGEGKPTAPSQILPHLSTLKRAKHIFQVEYNGHPLYTYSKDSRPGDAKGAGKGSFRVAAVATPRRSASSAGTSGSGPSGGSGSGG